MGSERGQLTNDLGSKCGNVLLHDELFVFVLRGSRVAVDHESELDNGSVDDLWADGFW